MLCRGPKKKKPDQSEHICLNPQLEKEFLGIESPRTPPTTSLVIIMTSPTFGTGAAGVLVFKGRPEDVFIKTLLAFGILAASFFGQTVKYGVVAQK